MTIKIKEKILIVDDDPGILNMLSAFLSDAGYLVETAESAFEGTQKLSSDHFSALLVDIFLPDTDGIRFIEEIRRQGNRTPVIMITGSSEVNLARKAIHLGVNDYLVKPFRTEILDQVVKNAVMQNSILEEQHELEAQKELYQKELEKLLKIKSQQLNESESKYQSLLEQTLAGVFIIQDDLFRYLNKKTCTIFECEQGKLLNQKSLLEFVHPEDYEAVSKHFRQSINGKIFAEGITFRIKTKKGNERFLEMWSQLVDFQNKPALEGILIDISKRAEAEMREEHLRLELLNEHKMAAIGRLTAGISHNLNTPISIIQGNAELLKLKYPESTELDKIIKQTRHMTELIQTIARKGQNELNAVQVEIHINSLLEDELEFLNGNLFYKHQIQKEFDFAEHLPSVYGIYSDFSQSLLQIIQNAIDAVYDSDIRKLHIATSFSDGNILIKIEDSGVGIAEEDKQKIFSPFYTTKPTQLDKMTDTNAPRGTGLGLSLAQNLLNPYKATIDFESELGKGTCFTIKIPVNSLESQKSDQNGWN